MVRNNGLSRFGWGLSDCLGIALGAPGEEGKTSRQGPRGRGLGLATAGTRMFSQYFRRSVSQSVKLLIFIKKRPVGFSVYVGKTGKCVRPGVLLMRYCRCPPPTTTTTRCRVLQDGIFMRALKESGDCRDGRWCSFTTVSTGIRQLVVWRRTACLQFINSPANLRGRRALIATLNYLIYNPPCSLWNASDAVVKMICFLIPPIHPLRSISRGRYESEWLA